MFGTGRGHDRMVPTFGLKSVASVSAVASSIFLYSALPVSRSPLPKLQYSPMKAQIVVDGFLIGKWRQLPRKGIGFGLPGGVFGVFVDVPQRTGPETAGPVFVADVIPGLLAVQDITGQIWRGGGER